MVLAQYLMHIHPEDGEIAPRHYRAACEYAASKVSIADYMPSKVAAMADGSIGERLKRYAIALRTVRNWYLSGVVDEGF